MSQGQRRLAAIMFTDMVGYTALGQRNESLSLVLVEEQRKVIRPILARHNGREVKTIGDAFLVEYPNAVDAVRCAYDIQRAIMEFNLSLESERRIRLKIGIHVGEVVDTLGDISGDAVNVASRIEPLAEGGGVCVTRHVYDIVRNKVDIPLSSLGLKSLKNVAEPMEVFRMILPWEKGEVAAPVKLDKTRVAVLPFANFSQESGDDYFADGLTEEMIGTLSKIRELRVISRTSVMQYKGKPKPIPEISRELNAGTILEGSVRKAGNRARVSIQMIDALEDQHVWAENYDRELQDIFAVQSDIAMKVAEALKIELLAGERKAVEEAPTKSPEANLLYLKGTYWGDRGDLLKEIEFLELAAEQDPQFALAYAMTSVMYVGAAGEELPAGEAFLRAKQALARALGVNPHLAEVQMAKGWLAFQYDWDWAEAERSFRESISLNPSLASAHDFYGLMLASLGRFDEAVSEVRRAFELNPASVWTMFHLGIVNEKAERDDEAKIMIERALAKNPKFSRALITLALIEAREGKKEAIGKADEVITLEDRPYLRYRQAIVHATIGSKVKANEILENLISGTYGHASPLNIGTIYYWLGNGAKGFEWVERALTEHDPEFPWENNSPLLRILRKDSRYVEVLRTLGLP